MKKSEFRRGRHRRWLDSTTTRTAGEVCDRVNADVAAAEAAGVEWDPEEEPLPERIECRSYPGFIDAALWPEGKTTVQSWSKEKYYQEAARRYNLHPRVREKVKRAVEDYRYWRRDPIDLMALKELLAILDGKEGA